jgi:DNA (cytosine-5)-methyltransferase 1
MYDDNINGLFIDNFCGGGGASTGIEAAIGRKVDIAINHDAEAVAMHAANHPDTEHACQDIWQAIPIEVTRAQPVAGAWFSPDCKEHSKAKGGPVKDRNIRDLPWTIPYWLESVQPVVAYLENVEEMRMWGPLIPNGDGKYKIDPERRGQEWDRWVRAIKKLGYKIQWRELRACDYGAPTSRKRLYVVMRRDGLPIIWPKPSHGPAGSWAVRAGKRLPYRTAAECIEWEIPTRSIFDRDRSLKDNTHRRIAHGVMRYVVNAAEPFIVPITHSGSGTRVHGIAEDPMRTVTTANGGELAIVDATLALHITKFHSGSVGSDLAHTMPTVTANGQPARPAGANPLGLVGATLVQTGYGEREGQAPRVPHLDKPIGTLMAGGGKHALVTAHLEKFNADSRPRPANEPLDTVMASSAQHAIVQTDLVEAAFLDRQFGKSLGADVEQPAPATTAGGGGKTAQVSAFMSRFYGSNKTASQGDLTEQVGVITSGGQHDAIVCAHMEQANTGMVGHKMGKPVSTIVGKGSTQRLVETTLIEEGSLPPEMMRKATMVAAFMVKYYGPAIGQPVDIPFHTATTRARFAVVTVTIDAVTYVIVDIGMRMLTPRELARAQGFPDSYVLEAECWQTIRGKQVWKKLTKAAQIRMIGNSVCPDVARALVGANQPGANDNRLGVVSEMRMAA